MEPERVERTAGSPSKDLTTGDPEDPSTVTKETLSLWKFLIWATLLDEEIDNMFPKHGETDSTPEQTCTSEPTDESPSSISRTMLSNLLAEKANSRETESKHIPLDTRAKADQLLNTATPTPRSVIKSPPKQAAILNSSTEGKISITTTPPVRGKENPRAQGLPVKPPLPPPAQSRKVLLAKSRADSSSSLNKDKIRDLGRRAPSTRSSTNTSTGGTWAEKIQQLVRPTMEVSGTDNRSKDTEGNGSLNKENESTSVAGTLQKNDKEEDGRGATQQQQHQPHEVRVPISKGMKLMCDPTVCFVDVARILEKEVITKESDSYEDVDTMMREYEVSLHMYKQIIHIMRGIKENIDLPGKIPTISIMSNVIFMKKMAFVAHAEYVIYYLYNNRFQEPLNNAFLSSWTDCLQEYKGEKDRIEDKCEWMKLLGDSSQLRDNKDIPVKGAFDLLLKIRAEIVSRIVRGIGNQLDTTTPDNIFRKAKNKFRQVSLDMDVEALAKKLRQLDMENHEEPIGALTALSTTMDEEGGNKKEWKVLKLT